LIGLEEILRRMDRYEEQLVKLREDMVEGFKNTMGRSLSCGRT